MCTATAAKPKKDKKPRKKPEFVPFRDIKVSLWKYDWVVINTSGGKDSQTLIRQMVLKAINEDYPLDRLVLVHCDLGGRVEWDGVRELVELHAKHYGLRLHIVSRPQGDLLDEVKQRAMSIWRDAIVDAGEEPVEGFDERKEQVVRLLGPKLNELASPWPSQKTQWCTADQKRGQVSKVMTQLTSSTECLRTRVRYKETKKKNEQTGKFEPTGEYERVEVAAPVRILNCMGMRGQESTRRAKQKPFRLNEATTKRIVHDFLPLFNWSAEQVWADIKESGVPYHPAYDYGMGRLSCCFCIYAPRNALMLAGKYNPIKLDEYVKTEQKVGSKFKVELSLLDVQEALHRGEEPGPVQSWEMP